MSMNFEFEVTVSNTFEAETPEEAVSQMIEWVQQVSDQASYEYFNIGTGEIGYIDAEDL